MADEHQEVAHIKKLRRDSLGYLKIANVVNEEGRGTKKGGP